MWSAIPAKCSRETFRCDALRVKGMRMGSATDKTTRAKRGNREEGNMVGRKQGRGKRNGTRCQTRLNKKKRAKSLQTPSLAVRHPEPLPIPFRRSILADSASFLLFLLFFRPVPVTGHTNFEYLSGLLLAETPELSQ